MATFAWRAAPTLQATAGGGAQIFELSDYVDNPDPAQKVFFSLHPNYQYPAGWSSTSSGRVTATATTAVARKELKWRATPQGGSTTVSPLGWVETVSGTGSVAPGVPVGVVAVAQDSASVLVSWEPPVARYQILRDGDEIGLSASCDYADTGLTANTQYSYQVRAIDAAGNASELSTPAIVTTPAKEEPPIPPLPSPSSVLFTDIPEIAFLAGYSQVAQLGPFQLDVSNRWTPGDLDRTQPSHRTGQPWTSRLTTQLVNDATSAPITDDPYITYHSATAEVRCSDEDLGTPTYDLHVRLQATESGEVSPPFRIRVLRAKAIWGSGAATHPKFTYLPPAQKFDPATGGSFIAAKNAMSASTDVSPGVLVVLGGNYPRQDFYIGERRFYYLLGEPGKRPVLNGPEGIGYAKAELFYVKNLELINIEFTEQSWRPDGPSAVYITECYHHDGTGGNGMSNPNGRTEFERKYWIWNYHGRQNGDLGNQQHQMYIEGRPILTLYLNNIRIDGARGCSVIKSDCKWVYVWNSDLSACLDREDPSKGYLAAILIDVPACGYSIVYNNRFWCYSDNKGVTGRYGLGSGTVYWRARKAWMCADIPAYPNTSWQPAVSTVTTRSAPPGFTDGPESYVDADLWEAAGAKAMTDETNPYAFAHFLAYNQWILLPSSPTSSRALRDDGTHPASGLSPKTNIRRTHVGFVERSVSFLANNRYMGYRPTPTFAMDHYASVTSVEPGAKWGTPYNVPPSRGRTIPSHLRVVGGELVGDGEFAPIPLPPWFQIARIVPLPAPRGLHD
jgi:hypothetical protein